MTSSTARLIAQAYQRCGRHAFAALWREQAARVELMERVEADRRGVG